MNIHGERISSNLRKSKEKDELKKNKNNLQSQERRQELIFFRSFQRFFHSTAQRLLCGVFSKIERAYNLNEIVDENKQAAQHSEVFVERI